MKKIKILSVVFFAVLVFLGIGPAVIKELGGVEEVSAGSPYYVYFGDIWIDTSTAEETTYYLNDGSGGITNEGADENNYNYSYDPETNTLTLNNADLNVASDYYNNCAIFSDYDINIVIEGDSYMYSTSLEDGSWIGIQCAAELNVTVEEDASLTIGSYLVWNDDTEEYDDVSTLSDSGIYSANGNVAIEVDGSYNIYASDTGLYATNNMDIQGSGDIYIDAGYYGIYVYVGDLTVSMSGKMNIDSEHYGIYDKEGNITFGGTGKINISSDMFGIDALGESDECLVINEYISLNINDSIYGIVAYNFNIQDNAILYVQSESAAILTMLSVNIEDRASVELYGDYVILFNNYVDDDCINLVGDEMSYLNASIDTEDEYTEIDVSELKLQQDTIEGITGAYFTDTEGNQVSYLEIGLKEYSVTLDITKDGSSWTGSEYYNFMLYNGSEYAALGNGTVFNVTSGTYDLYYDWEDTGIDITVTSDGDNIFEFDYYDIMPASIAFPAVSDLEESVGDYNIIINADEGSIENGAEFNIVQLESGADYETAISSLSDISSQFILFDISLLDTSGAEIQPEGSITFSISVPDGYTDPEIYYIAEDGTTTLLESTVEDGYIIFNTDHFSDYAVVDNGVFSSDTASSTASDETLSTDSTSAESTNTTTSTSVNTGDSSDIIVFTICLISATALLSVYATVKNKRSLTK